ncbi:integral membrane protein [Diaporthe helianthi]|uniref:Integral membrane protein n=1 Tax=Diaporthe helianthi TaxID=158607 RepID=A0A2P5HXY1_DIAHE|nr:integral membrane protein [Diaporthe helianthi]
MAISDLGISSGGLPPGPALTIVECFLTVAFYNVIELNVVIYSSFPRRTGLYFWSFVVATWGIAVYSVGFLTKDLNIIRNGFIYGTLIAVGWICMVTGQSMVLFSRMHLLVRDKRILRTTLACIVGNAIIGHVPTTVLLYGSNSRHPERWLEPYSIMERIHITIFFVQELAISAIYVVATIRLLRNKSRPSSPKASATGRRFLTHLIQINVIVVALDITILALEYAGLYVIQTAYKGMVYSVKLKLEFSILNALVDMTRAYRNARIGAPTRGLFEPLADNGNGGGEAILGKGSRGICTSGYAQLTQTVDHDGVIRYTGNNGQSMMGGHAVAYFTTTTTTTTGNKALELPSATHKRRNPDWAGAGTSLSEACAGGEYGDGGMPVPAQFVIPRHRREEWEEKSDLEELVLGTDILR